MNVKITSLALATTNEVLRRGEGERRGSEKGGGESKQDRVR